MQRNWSHGYVTEVPYTSGFYKEMTPTWLWFVANLLNQHFDLQRGYTYCELGCGTGFGLNVMAAANPDGIFYGIDINPSHISMARDLAASAGLENVHFFEADFVEIGENPPAHWPDFDIIALHGIYTWVNPFVRSRIVSFVSKKLKPGGLVYVSYNAFPGWLLSHPLRRLIWEYGQLIPGPIEARARRTLDFVERLKEAEVPFFKIYPPVAKKIEKVRHQNLNYFIHEYMNDHWEPFYFTDVVREFAEGKLHYLGSATISDNMDNFLPEALRKILDEIPDPIVREVLKDICVNKAFRRDIFVKGRVPRLPGERLDVLKHLVRFRPLRQDLPEEWVFSTSYGELKGNPEVYNAIFEALLSGKDRIADLEGLPFMKGKQIGALLQPLAMLVHGDFAHPLRVPPRDGCDHEPSRLFNRIVSEKVYQGAPLNFLAAPAIGSGILASFPELAIFALKKRRPDSSEELLVETLFSQMKLLGRRMMRDGTPVEGDEENLELLRNALKQYDSATLPRWRALGIEP